MRKKEGCSALEIINGTRAQVNLMIVTGQRIDLSGGINLLQVFKVSFK